MSETEELGGYRLERLLGRGTMGSVFLARPKTGPGFPVAIKRVPSLGTAEDRARLRREAETMASLNHPNIVRVLDVVDDTDSIALVMTYADGGTLADRIRVVKGMPAGDVQLIIAPIADALAAAHRQGVLHRDVKPSNILFTSQGVPLLADFGIARNAAHTNLTNTNMAMGTAGYLDPDLADGVEPSPASDQYALGVVAYEALTGSPPFDATSTPLAVLKAADRGEHKILDPNVHGPIANVIERAIQRNKDDRFPTLEAFARSLRRPHGTPPPAVATKPAEESPAPIDATRAFRRRFNAASMADATPVVPKNTRRKYVFAAASLCVLSFIAVAVAVNSGRSRSLKTLGPYPFPLCNVQTTSQCLKSAVRITKGMQVVFENDSRGTYTIGEPSDAMIVGNWFCGTRATLALYRPRTGVIYYYNNWPDPDGEPTIALVDSTHIRSAQLAAGDHNNDHCADIALDLNGARTWFMPHVQPDRLRRAPVTAGDPTRPTLLGTTDVTQSPTSQTSVTK
jgi:eukaryotic-like serine/threonine-protein kinase